MLKGSTILPMVKGPRHLLSRWRRPTAGGVFRSMRVRNYRLFFTGHAVSVCGTWMQRVAQDWLIFTLTGSGVALGIAAALQFGPMLVLGIWGGSVVDRYDRRRLLVLTQTLQAALALALGLLTVTGVVQLWMVYALTTALGIVTVVDSPARSAFVSDLVGPDDYVNAQSLNSTMHNAGRLVGPAFAGLLIASAGVGTAFLVNAASFAAVLVSLTRMDRTALRPRAVRPAGAGAERASEGLRYVWSHPELRACMVIVLVVGLFGQNFRVVLPLLASDTFGAGAAVYGYLTAALGLGAVLGALFTASRQTASPRGMLIATVAFGLTNLLAAAAPSLLWAYASLVLMGVANICVNTLGRTLLMVHSPPSMHGRILAFHGLVFLGTTPFGGPLLGWVCELAGARSGLLLAAVTALLVSVGVARRMRRGPVPAVSRLPVVPVSEA
jgi:MFS family permease